ncbi:MAG: hypothetical protein RMA76_29655 [Deltaproteobacteria bacterium]
MKNVYVLSIIGVGLLSALWLWRPSTSQSPDAVDQDARHYRLALTVRDETRLPVAEGAAVPVTAEVHLQTDLLVTVPTPRTRGLRFVRVDAATLAVGDDGRSGSLASAVEGLDALVVLRDDGTVAGIRVPERTELVAERLVKLVASELVWTRPAKGVTHERTRLGEVESSYAIDARTFVRTRRGVRSWAAFDGLGVRGLRAELTGGARGAIVEDDMITTLEVDERVVAYRKNERLLQAQTRLDLELLGRVAAPSAARLGPLRSLVDHPVSVHAEARAQDARIAGLTADALWSALDRTGASGEFADHARMLVRATALLRKQPALVDQVGARFREPATSDAERTLLLDLLVGAGTPAAQAALTELLDEPLVRTHPERHLWDQRVSLIGAPTPATVTYASAAFARRSGVDGTTAAYVLGAVASHLPDRRAAAAPIVERLKAAREPFERAHLISALGNAGGDAFVGSIAAYADAGEPEVRLAVAKALRKTDVEDARATLVRLSADRSAVVQRRALLSLSRMSTLSPAELDALGAAVRTAAVAQTSLGALVNLLAAQPCSSRRDAVLRAVRAQPKEGGAVIDARTRALEARCG